MCRHNAKVARSANFSDLNKSWKLVSRMSNLLCDNEKKALQNMDNKVIIYDNDQNDTELTVQVGN